MTMLDDDRLAELFDLAAEAFAVPESGPAEILARAARPARAGADADADAEAGAGAGAGAGAEAEETGDGDAARKGTDADPADELGRRRRIVAVARRHRLLSVASVVVVALIVAGAIGAVVGSQSPSRPAVSALRLGGEKGTTTPGSAAGGVATTTIPAHTPGLAFGASGEGAAAPSSSSPSTGTQNQSVPGLPQGAVGQSTKIEQTGTLSLTVKRGELTRAITGLTDLASSVGGFVATSQSQDGSGGGTASGNITLEVPVDDFASVLKAAERYGKTTNVSTNATDVTGQYVDLQARLNALEASRQQYLTILSKATSIGDILSVQEQLDGIQQQIEQLQGQLQVLTSETSYSKLDVTLNEGTTPPPPGPLPESGLVQAWHDSVGGFVAGVEGVIRLAGPFLFALLCLALVAVGGRVLWRRYQRHRL